MAARFAIEVTFLELPDEKAAGFWPAAGWSKKLSAEASDESETREEAGGAVPFLRRIPTLSPTCKRLRAQETGRIESPIRTIPITDRSG